MRLTSLLSPKRIRLGLPGVGKDEVIRGTIDLLEGDDRIRDLSEVHRVVFERESQMSTGVGKGLGLPHGKTPSLSSSIAALAITQEPIDYRAFDGQPVRIVFLLVGPVDAQSVHIRTLSRISRIMNNDGIRESVLNAKSSQAVYDIISKAEEAVLKS